MSVRKAAVWTLTLAATLALAAPSFGCPVCFGESDAPVVKGAELSILFMMGVTYTLIGSGFATFLILRRRRRQASDIGTQEL